MRQRKRPSHQCIPGEATPFMKALQSRVLRFVRRHGVLPPGERALLAVSGGQDSSAVLLIVSRLAAELGVEVSVAHFDHRLRSSGEARADEEAVRGLAQALGLPFAAAARVRGAGGGGGGAGGAGGGGPRRGAGEVLPGGGPVAARGPDESAAGGDAKPAAPRAAAVAATVQPEAGRRAVPPGRRGSCRRGPPGRGRGGRLADPGGRRAGGGGGPQGGL